MHYIRKNRRFETQIWLYKEYKIASQSHIVQAPRFTTLNFYRYETLILEIKERGGNQKTTKQTCLKNKVSKCKTNSWEHNLVKDANEAICYTTQLIDETVRKKEKARGANTKMVAYFYIGSD